MQLLSARVMRRALQRQRGARPTASADVVIRSAVPADNASLVRLTESCPMRAGLTVCIHRAPDFFALSRLQGEPWRVVVAEHATAGIIGCVGLAGRLVWVNGTRTPTLYVGDLKVDPRFRGRGIGDRLIAEVRAQCAAVGDGVPVWLAALAGNRAIERRIPGPRLTPCLTCVGTVRVHTLFAAGRRRGRGDHDGALAVRAASADDIALMAELWNRVAPARQGAPVLDARGLEQWIAHAPGLAVSDYLLAFRGRRLAAFLGVWDQRGMKEMRVLRYGAAAGAVRIAYNFVAPVLGAPPLPPAGGALRALHVLHLCAPAGQADALRALLLEARRRCARRRVPLLEVGLDSHDPLARALRGFPGVRTDVRCYVTSPGGDYRGPALDTRPLHFETALV